MSPRAPQARPRAPQARPRAADAAARAAQVPARTATPAARTAAIPTHSVIITPKKDYQALVHARRVVRVCPQQPSANDSERQAERQVFHTVARRRRRTTIYGLMTCALSRNFIHTRLLRLH